MMNKANANFCRYCGKPLDGETERQDGCHQTCRENAELAFCSYCGKKRKESDRFWKSQGHTCCSNECVNTAIIKDREDEQEPYRKLFPKFHKRDIDWIHGCSEGGYGGHDISLEEFKDECNDNHDKVIVLFRNSDGMGPHEVVEPNVSILNYIVKNRHGKTLGMGCNEYVYGFIYQGESFKFGGHGNGRLLAEVLPK